MSIAQDTTQNELTLDEVANKYPDIPRLIILKTDAQRRGVYYTPRALTTLDPARHQIAGGHIFGTRDGTVASRPESLILRDGTYIIVTATPQDQNPYVCDLVGDKLFLHDNGRPIEEVEFWPRAQFYDKTTSSGLPMSKVVYARPTRLTIFPYRYCNFWNEGNGCLFCDIVPQAKKAKTELGLPLRTNPDDIAEAVGEALKETGKYTGICLTGGSIMGGAEVYDDEVDYYIKVLQAIGKHFRTPRFTSQLIASAFNPRQLRRLYDQTGLSSYTSDLEVLNEPLFNWLCPGKAKWVGYQESKRRLIAAAEIFGRGSVNTGIVAGIELARPNGFTDEDQALDAILSEAEDLARHGVGTSFIVWGPRPDSALGAQKNASLEYYVRLTRGLHEQRIKYDLRFEFDDFRNCGNHPNTDLFRLL